MDRYDELLEDEDHYRSSMFGASSVWQLKTLKTLKAGWSNLLLLLSLDRRLGNDSLANSEARTMFAHYFSTKAQKFIIISDSSQPVGKRIQVSGKAEARKVAAANNAKPWNF